MTTVRKKEPEPVEEPVYDLTEEEEAELEDRMREIERGEYVDWDDIREERLRRRQS
ncbi:MAG TPA: hypothetical protein VGD79_00390 [Thermoanaerobaculia bacterium]|jgi:hypothetical protein